MNLRPILTNSTRLACLGAILALAACGSLSKVTDQGSTDQPVWPDASSVTFKTGSFPTLDSLQLMGPGMTKDQIYALLGRPHFNEGLAGVHEWDYLFHFRTLQGVQTCQYKVLFDKDMLSRNIYWNPESCASVLGERETPKAEQSFSLDSDVLFRFDSAELTPTGSAEVRRVAAALRGKNLNNIKVTGHTDRIGADAYNQDLSRRRALSVRSALARDGIAQDRISAQGLGESQPVSQCGEMARDSLIACLAPDRRVVISVAASAGQ